MRPRFRPCGRTCAIGVLLLGLATSIHAAPAGAAAFETWQQPQLGSYDPALVARARAENEAAIAAGLHPRDFEDAAQARREQQAFQARLEAGEPFDDNDACHYARGSVLIMHVFVDHQGGTWTPQERNAQAAKADIAKQYYVNETAHWWLANMQFDNQGTTQYWFNQVSLGYAIPDSGFTKDDMENALALMGVTDNDGDGWLRDDYSFGLQFWNGGWDNVIVVFQPADIAGRPFASGGGFATIGQYQVHSAGVWKHEWGHAFGAPDEYVENGMCSGGGCEVYPHLWLTEEVENGNCGLCPGSGSCIMKSSGTDYQCQFTRRFWGRADADENDQLDPVRRFEPPNSFPTVNEMWNGGAYGSNTTTNDFVAAVGQRAWAVFGLRSPPGADYNLRMYLDNGHHYQPATSQYGGQTVDFIVADYNLNNLGNEHFKVDRWSGSTAPYNIVWMQTGEEIYADGIVRGYSWNANHVVQCWDVPLLGGESVAIALENTSGTGDYGMALFRSAGQTYYANRSAALFTRDATGAGASEYHTFDVPVDDVYCLVVWSNQPANGSFTLKLGPTPVVLHDESSFFSGLDVRLFQYQQYAPAWNVVATRPDAGMNVTLRLYQDVNYTSLLSASDDYAGLEFIASDYVLPDVEYPRVSVVSGAGGHATEWDTGSHVSTGYVTGSWAAADVARVWDVYLEAGQTYYFRQYHTAFITSLDAGIHLMKGDGTVLGAHQAKKDAVARSDVQPPSAGGEWFSYNAPATGFYGLVMGMNNAAPGAYSLWHGPRLYSSSAENFLVPDEAAFCSTVPLTQRWGVYGARPGRGAAVDISLFENDNFSSLNAASVGQVGEVNFVAVDYDAAQLLDPEYHRYRRTAGYAPMAIEYEAGFENLTFAPGETAIHDLTWSPGDVVKVFNLWIDGTFDLFQEVEIVIQDMSNDMDLGAAMFSTGGSQHLHMPREDADLIVDDYTSGGIEVMHYAARFPDWHGLVLFNNNSLGGDYRLIIREPSVVSTPPGGHLPTELALRPSMNPFHGATTLRVEMPADAEVEVSVHDVSGRRLRSLASGRRVAGVHDLHWDGRDAQGRMVDAGVYFARLRAGAERRAVKMVRLP